MPSGLLVILVIGAALGGWALLAVMEAERQRLRTKMEAKRSEPSPKPPARFGLSGDRPAPPKSAPPPRSAAKPARVEKNVR